MLHFVESFVLLQKLVCPLVCAAALSGNGNKVAEEVFMSLVTSMIGKRT